jgi:predicted dithiol-disulfide oxidoreductase (DUF899 family)
MEFTRAHDQLNADRRRLPMVRIDQEYVFEGPDGPVTLAGLFGDRRQLIIQHVMLGPDWDQPCPGCTAAIEEIAPGLLGHLQTRDTVFVLASRAPYDKIAAVAKERGWTVPWYSTYGSDFNYDFQVSLDESLARCSTTTGRSRGSSAASGPARCPATAASCVTARTSITPTRPSPAAANTSAAPTPCST